MRLVVGDELDEQLAAAGDDGRRRDLPAELPHHGRGLVAAVVDLHVVVPAEEGGGGEEETAAFSFVKHRTHCKTQTDVDGSGADPSDKSLIVSDIKLRTQRSVFLASTAFFAESSPERTQLMNTRTTNLFCLGLMWPPEDSQAKGWKVISCLAKGV